MNSLLHVIQFVGFLTAIVCFFWSLKYRRDDGSAGPYAGLKRSRLVEFYGPKGARIAFIGSASFILSGVAALGYYLTN